MQTKIWYPTVNDIIEYNKLILSNKKFLATKAEKHEVLNKQTIIKAIASAKDFPGDIEDKAAVLVQQLQYHPFVSANRRTAFYAMNVFLGKNKGYMVIKRKSKGEKFMTDIRNGVLTHQQIKDDIKFDNFTLTK